MKHCLSSILALLLFGFSSTTIFWASKAHAAYDACEVLRKMNELQSRAGPMSSYKGRSGKFRTTYYRNVRIGSEIRKKVEEWKENRGSWEVVDDVVVK